MTSFNSMLQHATSLKLQQCPALTRGDCHSHHVLHSNSILMPLQSPQMEREWLQKILGAEHKQHKHPGMSTSIHYLRRIQTKLINVSNVSSIHKIFLHNTLYREILATVLIWLFGDSEVNCQIKKSPLIRYQSRPDTHAAPSPSYNKCARIGWQSYS